jgi:hypothetical protein
VEPHKKQLHISLAYQFSTDKKDHLEAVAKSLNMHLPVRWDLRLYSRDSKLQSCQVNANYYFLNGVIRLCPLIGPFQSSISVETEDGILFTFYVFKKIIYYLVFITYAQV